MKISLLSDRPRGRLLPISRWIGAALPGFGRYPPQEAFEKTLKFLKFMVDKWEWSGYNKLRWSSLESTREDASVLELVDRHV